MFPRFNAHVGRSVGTAFAIFATTAAVIASVGPDTAPASSPSSGTFQAYKGGFRKPLDNTALGYSYALAGATFEESTSTGFGSSTPFGPTDSSGLASLSTSTGTHYVREKTAPSGWRALSSLTWGEHPVH
ncbi:MAG: hypothetical protein NTX07_06275 [Solirubrobacterales bacterium]|nr:hypothetical protein [Solirubrobacterales bacterium]